MNDGHVIINGHPDDDTKPIIQKYSGGAKSQSNFFFEIAKENVIGHSSIHKFGGYDTVPNGSFVDLWHKGGALTHLTTASVVHLISSNAGDNQASTTGIRNATVYGLDSNFVLAQENLLMHATDGTIAGPSGTTTFIRIYRVVAQDAGAYTRITNLGNIDVIADTGGTTQGYIEAGAGQSQGTHYTIPANKKAYIKRVSITMDTGKSVDVILKTRPSANITSVPTKAVLAPHHWKGIATPVEEIFSAHHIFEEYADIWFEAQGNGATAEVEVDYDLILVDNG